MTIKLFSVLRLTALVLIIMASNPSWSEPLKPEHEKLGAEKQSVASSPSRMAYIDEDTGELISTPPADTAPIDAIPNAARSAEEQGIEYITHPDGTVEGKLDGHYQSQLTATLGCDGSLTKTHSSGSSARGSEASPDGKEASPDTKEASPNEHLEDCGENK